ncbi:MAG: outer membrane protein assembly factor BamA [Elusimicrobia bacterium]|nr:outer membrane protein assembly factor BamA [Elusimicrobiota bacterium]
MNRLLMSALAAAVLSSSGWSQTVSSGTAPGTPPPTAAPAVSTSAPSAPGGALPPLPGLPAPAVSTSAVPTPAVSSAAAAVQPAPPAAPGVVPSPWVLADIKAVGLKNVRMTTLRGRIKARKGDLYDRPDLDRDIQALLGLGQFDQVGAQLTVTSKPVPERYRGVAGTPREVILTFTVSEKPVIRRIKFEGQKKLSQGVLLDAIATKDGDPYDRYKLEDDAQKVIDKYHERGFLDATARFTVKEDTAASKDDVVFHVAEGPKSRIELVAISGVHAFKLKKILKLMKNRRHKVYFEKDLPDDLKKIEDAYKNNGYLDVQVSSPVVTLSPDKTRISIAFGVKEGRPYRFGETTFSGFFVVPSSSIYHCIDYKPGAVFSQQKFEETIRDVQELYADEGRLRTRVLPTKTFDPKTDRMDVRFDVIEGPISYIDHVDVDGNKATKTYVIKREILVKPGQRFSAKLVRKSRERIMNLGFMDEVNVDLEPSPEDPNKVDLTYDVAEGKPGMLTAGAAYSSIDGLIGTMSLQHMNLFGRAQRASVQWSFGKRVQDYSLSWTTPWVGNHPTSLGFDVFHTRRINPYQGDLAAYTEHRTGGTVRLGPRFQDDEYQLNFSYTLQKVGIDGIDPNVDFQGTLTPGTSVQSLLSAEFARDTRDSIWDPTRGSRNSIGAELSGGPLMGDIDFFKPYFSNQIHWDVYDQEDWPFVLSLFNRGGYITQFGRSKIVAVQDRFYIGGQDSLRGYSPSGEAGYPNGGTVYDVANLEFGAPLAREHHRSIVKLVAFFDIGGAWNTPRDVTLRMGGDTADVKSDVGLGLRFVTPAFPIRLDYGYGLNHRPGEKLYQVNFGLGPLF